MKWIKYYPNNLEIQYISKILSIRGAYEVYMGNA